VEWIQLAQDRDRWWAVVNTVMSLRVLTPLSSSVSSLFSRPSFISVGRQLYSLSKK
jgi:hypothetical protein